MKKNAVDYYINKGYSCSESVVMAAIDAGLCDKSLLPCATAFSGGMSSGCLCGAVAGAQLVIGYNYGKENSKGNDTEARIKAAHMIEEFKKRHRVTCCKALTAGLEGIERKQHCCRMVGDSAEILEELIRVKINA